MNLVDRDKAGALIPTQEIVDRIIQGTVKGSKAMELMTKLPNMTTKQAKLPVLASLPEAYFVNGDAGLKQTTDMMWKNKSIVAEELAVIVPIPEAVLDDSSYNLWGEIEPRVIEAFAKKFDQAVFLGKDRPASWPEGLIPSVINAGGAVAPGSNNLYTQISDAMGKVEEDGFDVTGIVGGVGLKKAFRDGLLDSTGQPLANSEVTALNRVFVDNGSWDNSLAKFVVGDFKQAMYSIRQDITFKFLSESVITDDEGKVVLNLAQQDCVALRAVMRLGWVLPNPINALNPDEATRFPFALVENTTAPTTYDVTVTVKDNSTVPAAVKDAEVNLAGQVKKTNASGVATFKSLGEAEYVCKVSKTGYKPTYSDVTVAKEAANVNVTLVAKKK